MSTPFPGMDPYLERRGLWEGVHTRLLVALADAIAPRVRPRYRVDVEQRTYLAVMTPDDLIGKPDVLILATREPDVAYRISRPPGPVTVEIAELPMPEEVVERYLEIRDLGSGDVVTVIELLSHSNKSSREGRAQYERKRLAVLASLTHLIEIDLLRAGDPMPMRVSATGAGRITASLSAALTSGRWRMPTDLASGMPFPISRFPCAQASRSRFWH